MLCQPCFSLNIYSVSWDLIEDQAASAIPHLRRGFFFPPFSEILNYIACLMLFLLPQPSMKESQFHPDFFWTFLRFNHFNQSGSCLSLQNPAGQFGNSLFSPLFAATRIPFLQKLMQCLTYHIFRRRQISCLKEQGQNGVETVVCSPRGFVARHLYPLWHHKAGASKCYTRKINNLCCNFSICLNCSDNWPASLFFFGNSSLCSILTLECIRDSTGTNSGCVTKKLVPMDVALVWLACTPRRSSSLSHTPLSSPKCVSVILYIGAETHPHIDWQILPSAKNK